MLFKEVISALKLNKYHGEKLCKTNYWILISVQYMCRGRGSDKQKMEEGLCRIAMCA